MVQTDQKKDGEIDKEESEEEMDWRVPGQDPGERFTRVSKGY